MDKQSLGLVAGILVIGVLYAFSTGLTDFKMSNKPSVDEFNFPEGANKTTVYDKSNIFSTHIRNIQQTSFSETLTEEINTLDGKYTVSFNVETDRNSGNLYLKVETQGSDKTLQNSETAESFYSSESTSGFQDLEGLTRQKTRKDSDYTYDTITWSQSNAYLFDEFRDTPFRDEMVVPPVSQLKIGDFQAIRSRSGEPYARYGIEQVQVLDGEIDVNDGYILVGQNSKVKEISLQMETEQSGQEETAKLDFEYRFNEIERLEEPDWVETARQEVGLN